jgi:hypothetical protein
MSRVGFRLAVVAAGLVAMVVGSAPASGASAPAPSDQLRSFVCQKALDPPT